MKLMDLYKKQEDITCILCGDILEVIEEPIKTLCDYCGKTSLITHECKSDHFICDICYNIDTYDFIINQCLKYKGYDVIELAINIMNSPVIKMHGSEHHFIVPAVLYTCTHNKLNNTDDLEKKLLIIKDRSFNETSDHCTFKAGTCGAAFGTGVFLSVYNDRSLYSEDEWSETNHIIADSLKKVAESPGPRCCKRDTYLSLLASVSFLNDKYAIELIASEPKCIFSLRNKNCGREECEFFNLANDLV